MKKSNIHHNDHIKKCLPIIIIGMIFLLYIFFWYKQFSYFHYTGDTLRLDDERLTELAKGAGEKEYDPYPEYTEQIGRIVFWPPEYSDIAVMNQSESALMITISDYAGGDVPDVMQPVTIQGGEEFCFRADGRGDYVVTAYGEEALEGDAVVIRYGNHGYMDRWKKAVYVLLGCILVLTGVFTLLARSGRLSNGHMLSRVALAGSVVACLTETAARVAGLEDWNYVFMQFLAVFFAFLAIVCNAPREEPGEAEKNAGKENCTKLWIAVSMFLAILVHAMFLTSRSGSALWVFTGTLDSNRRILGYLITFMVFLTCFCLLGALKLPGKLLWSLRSHLQGGTAALSIICILYILGVSNSSWTLFSVIILLFLLFQNRLLRGSRIPKKGWVLYYALITLLIAAEHCVINFWDAGDGDVYHTGTFYHSIYFVASDEPFYGGLNQMYGHFALFYKIPLMLFGNNMRTVGMTTAVFSGVAVLSLLLAVHGTLKNDLSRILFGLVAVNCFIFDKIYLQTFPLRMLWPFILLLYLRIVETKPFSAWIRAGGYILCTLAILWNMESGLVCAMAWAVCSTARKQKDEKLAGYAVGFFMELLFILVEIAGAYLIVKCYNMALMDAGRRITELVDWKKEVPTLAREEAGDTSNGKLFWSNAPWIGMEMVLMGAISVWAGKVFIERKKVVAADTMELFLSVFSAGIFIYWMGRPEEYDIMLPYIGAILAVHYDRVITKGYDWKPLMTHFSAFLVFVVSAFGIAGIIGQMPATIRTAADNLLVRHVADYSRVEQYLQGFRESVPAETYGEAYGTRMVYMSLGWEMENEGLGWGSGMTDLEEKIGGHRWILLNDTYIDIPSLRREKEVGFGRFTYVLYENTEE